MGYKPTLGGLKKAQEFLEASGHPLPVFQTDIYEGGHIVPFGYEPGPGRTIRLDEAIREFGPMHRVADVRLTSEARSDYVIFADLVRAGQITAQLAYEDGYDVVLSVSDTETGTFVKDHLEEFFALSRWGKQKVSFFDQLKFLLLPRQYANRVFG